MKVNVHVFKKMDRAVRKTLARIKTRAQEYYKGYLDVTEPHFTSEDKIAALPMFCLVEVKNEWQVLCFRHRTERMLVSVDGYFSDEESDPNNKKIECTVYDGNLYEIVREEMVRLGEEVGASSIEITIDN